jgi:DNA-binding response OmpR family regulator
MRGHVLVVEDHALTAGAMVRLFERVGFRVTKVVTADEAKAALSAKPDCIVLDLLLRQGHGLDVLREIRAQSLPARIIVATGSGALTPMDEVSALKPDAIFIKPFNPTALVEWVEQNCCEPSEN